MQIHELTSKKKNTHVDEGIADAIGGVVGKGISALKGAGQAMASPFNNAAAGYSSGRREQKIDAMADKAYRSWKNYEGQLLKADPNARQNGDYEKQLLAFVNKNLLGGMYLPDIINKDKIITLVRKISTPPPATGAAGAIGQMAAQLGSGPAAGAKTATSTGGTAARTAGVQVHTANPNNPNSKAAVPESTAMTEAVDPTRELFKQLVQQAALAQTAAPGTGGAGSPASGAAVTAAGNNSRATASSLVQTLRQKLPPTTVGALSTAGAVAAGLTGSRQITSTGNPAADGLLILMGFQGP